jgi:dimethylglycine dehydrogenase
VKTHTQVAVIGGGIVGCAVLYHLTKLGMKDVVLLERKELTSGSSWHAAGGIHSLNSDINITKLQAYTISMYKEIQELSGQDVGLHMTGGLNIAATRQRWDYLRADFARHRVLGLETELLGPDEIKELCPLMDVKDVLGAVFDKHEGHIDPSGATHAYAKAAKFNGAEIYRHTRVTDLKPTGNGSWRVITDKGEIEAEHVVNAAGLWAREMGAMVGVQLPLIPMEHHYLVTDEVPEIAAAERELPMILDADAEIYMRQEGKGMLVGVYEKQATPWAVSGTPWEFGETDLLPPDLDRITDALLKGYQRFPAVENAGIRRIVNGPFTFTPDGNPLVGPVPGVPNYWAACGVMAGFCQGAGVALTLAQWIVDGEPAGDVLAMDVARFGKYATPAYVMDKVKEFYSRRFQIAYQNDYWPAGRPSNTNVLYDRLKSANCVFGVSYGVETPLYFAPPGEEPVETPSLIRSNAFASVEREVNCVQDSVGVMDCSAFAKYEVSGPGCIEALDRIIANKLPDVGRIRLGPLLSESGRLMGDLTVFRLEDERFLLVGSGYLQTWHSRWFSEHLPESVTFRNVSDELQGIQLVGPRSRDVLQRLVNSDVSHSVLGPMRLLTTNVGLAPATVARLSLTGELSYEIYAPAGFIRSIYESALEAGREFDIADFGLYALNSMRLEKSIGIWSREFSRDYTAAMSGLDRFVDYTKANFIGKAAAKRELTEKPDRKLVTLVVDTENADAAGYEPIWAEGQLVGFVTSGGYGHRVKASIVMGYVDQAAIDGEGEFEISILGERRPARLVTEALYDPENIKSWQN